MNEHRFQIDLRGMIDLLANHLYSSPTVFVRELLQNAVDAITARTRLDPAHLGEIQIELTPGRGDAPPTLLFSDNGIGLTKGEVHRFLSTIGESSKREQLGELRDDFLGQFGIGILSCFMVADEIVVITRSARKPGPTLEWRGGAKGTYSVREIDLDAEPGTQVYLRARPGVVELFTPDEVRRLALHYGGLLPVPIRLLDAGGGRVLNARGAPWRSRGPDRDEKMLALGREAFGMEMLDAIPLRSKAGDADGVAYVLPESVSLAARPTHRVYLRNMLLSEKADDLLPTWAFFVKCIVNVNTLRPTASREAFYEDAELERTREALGRSLRGYLMHLAEHDRGKLRAIIKVHYLAMKALAVDDDEFFGIIADWLPFETSAGRMALRDYRELSGPIRFTRTVDEFRQIAGVAAARSMVVINAGYTYDEELLRKLARLEPDADVERLRAPDLIRTFSDPDEADRARVDRFLEIAEETLRPFKCRPEAKRFPPAELPALYSIEKDARFRRSIDRSKEETDALWSSVLESVGPTGDNTSGLCFNLDNPLVRSILAVEEPDVLRLAVETLYVQSLLLGHHPLRGGEMKLLNRGLAELLERAIRAGGG